VSLEPAGFSEIIFFKLNYYYNINQLKMNAKYLKIDYILNLIINMLKIYKILGL